MGFTRNPVELLLRAETLESNMWAQVTALVLTSTHNPEALSASVSPSGKWKLKLYMLHRVVK